MTTMQDLIGSDDAGIIIYKYGQSLKGVVIDANQSRVLLELPSGQVGIITKKETIRHEHKIEEIDNGTEIEAIVLDPENESGLVVLSLRRASIDTAWSELGKMSDENRILRVKIEDANKGGLIAHYKGLKAFLPVSQLTPMNYPRVSDGSGTAILRRLQEHIGKIFAVRLMGVNREEGRIIISEKAAHDEQIEQALSNISEGDQVKGIVSGIMKFGIFVTFNGIEGLVHLSELDWAHVSDPGKKYSIGDKVEVLVIGKDGEKLSFSIKRLTEDPWLKKVEPFKEGQEVSGKVVRWNQNGVFIEIAPDVQGLFSLDQFGVENYSDLRMSEGQAMQGEILEINYNSHRLELKKTGEDPAPKKSTKKKKDEKKDEENAEDSVEVAEEKAPKKETKKKKKTEKPKKKVEKVEKVEKETEEKPKKKATKKTTKKD